MSVIDDWRAGRVSAEQALHALASDLDETLQEIATLRAQEEALKEQIGLIVAENHNRVELRGYGTFTLRAPARVTTWDGKALEQLIASLRETGYAQIADEIAGCTKTSARAGGLAIQRAKGNGRMDG
ncbi:MAG TPA: hypothetical protein VFT99_00860 [Roseiflexaceae bacterium]|nr:hypothetical protein [Roseiflexaceae bacterium]